MARSPASTPPGPASSHRLLFFGLVALLLVVGGLAWSILRGDSTPVTPAIARRDPPPEDAVAPPPAPTIEASQPDRVDDWNRRMNEVKGTTFTHRSRNGDSSTITTYPLSGSVVDDRAGESVNYFWIYLIPVDQGDPAVVKSSWSPSHFRGGKFQLDHQPEGAYNLIVESREHEAVTRTIQVPYEDGSLEVRLHHGSCIRGVVRDTSMTPLKDVEINLGVDPARIDDGAPPPMQRLVKSDDLGRYSFWKVPAGTYSLKVTLLGDELASEREFRLDRGAEVLRDFTLERLGMLKLTVTNVADQPVARARVVLVQEKEGRDRPVRTAYSDLKGVARLDFVREGSYKLLVKLQGFRDYEEPVAVAAGENFREMPVRLEVAPLNR